MTDPIAAALDSLAPDERPVLAVDQFEETASPVATKASARLRGDLVRVADDPEQRLIVVLAIPPISRPMRGVRAGFPP